MAELTAWNAWHERTVLKEIKLRRRGSTAENLKGRGQLSIPLFHWMSQLVKRNDPLVQHCKWFMKCDTDTYLRRGLLEREVLSKLDHTKPLHVGVPLKFNIRPYHHTMRIIDFEYNIGGPGYTFSRGLLEAVDTQACLRSMAMDPVLLIHDDVATGYCATYHAPMSSLVELNTAVSSSSTRLVTLLLTGTTDAPATLRDTPCVKLATTVHPVDHRLLKNLAQLDVSTATLHGGQCHLKAMAGVSVQRGGSLSTLGTELDNMFALWSYLWMGERQLKLLNNASIKVDPNTLRNAIKLRRVLFPDSA
jgi:hypothetical protein